jgi:RNA polymerase sigma-70 factor (ECF subfamily)
MTAAAGAGAATDPESGTAADVTQLYDQHVAFVWRNLRRLGVVRASLDDATQDVFLVVHRRIADAPVENVRSWLFGILRRVAADHRRRGRRKGAVPIDGVPEPAASDAGPERGAERAEAARMIHAILERLDDDKREVFVLAELEQMTAPEIAEAIGVPVNTVYSRLRVARGAFESHAAKLAADADGGRAR